MKTFDEACRSTFVFPSNNDQENMAAAIAISELAARWQPMIEEIRASKLTHTYIRGMIAAVAAEVMEVDAAFLSAFVSGIIIGREMYDSGAGIAAESVPGRRERGANEEPPPAPGSFTAL